MIVGVGTDIIEISRISEAINKSSFISRYFTKDEVKLFKTKKMMPETIAGNFAVKEAVSKALGTGFSGFSPVDIEVLRDENGKPYVRLMGGLQIIALEKGISVFHVSISHDGKYAIAYVVAEGGLEG